MSSLKLTAKEVTSKDGTKIFAEACGDYTKPHVVFVHGLACAGTAFNELFKVPKIQESLYLVRYDARGHARSGMPETEEAYESHCYAEDFAAVCETFKLNKPFYAGWSLAGSIAADICANNNPVPISGVIWLAALPYLGDVLPIVATPLVLSFLPGLTAPEDPTHALTARTGFCETLVAPDRLETVPFPDMQSWVGAATFLKPKCAGFLLGRKQDPERLKEELGKGLPLCIIHGKEDLQINGFNVVEQMQPQAKDCETLVAPDRLATVPFPDMQSWVGAATFLKPKCAGFLLGRKQDPESLKEELGKGLPLCIIHGKEDLQINGFNVVEQMQPQAKDCEVHLLDKIGHIPFWEDPQTCADLITEFVYKVKGL